MTIPQKNDVTGKPLVQTRVTLFLLQPYSIYLHSFVSIPRQLLV